MRFKAHKFSAYLFRSGTLRAIALYALNALKKARDISFSRNLPGIMTNVGPAPGPDGRRGTSYEFLWRKKSFIYFPNHEKLDAKNSIAILACLQVYKVRLNARQILRGRNRCFVKGLLKPRPLPQSPGQLYKLWGYFKDSSRRAMEKNAGGWSSTQKKRCCHGLLPFSGKKGISCIWYSKWRRVFLWSPCSPYLQQI